MAISWPLLVRDPQHNVSTEEAVEHLAFTPFRMGNLQIKGWFIISAAADGAASDLDARVKR